MSSHNHMMLSYLLCLYSLEMRLMMYRLCVTCDSYSPVCCCSAAVASNIMSRYGWKEGQGKCSMYMCNVLNHEDHVHEYSVSCGKDQQERGKDHQRSCRKGYIDTLRSWGPQINTLVHTVLNSVWGHLCYCPPLVELQLAEEKKKAHSLTDVMKKTTKVVLLKVHI